MSSSASTIKAIRDGLVNALKVDTDLVKWHKKRVFNNDLHVVSVNNFPIITVQLKKKLKKESASQIVGHIPRFIIRGYSRDLNPSRCNDELIEIGEAIDTVLTRDPRLGGLCTDMDVIDIDYIYLENKKTKKIFMQCVQLTVDCEVYLPRN
jgi:hypothetical protein